MTTAEAKLVYLQAEHARKNDPNVNKEEPSVADKLAAVESLLSGSASGDSLDEQIQTQKRMVDTLITACRLQAGVLGDVVASLSAAAGRDNEEKHKALVRRMLELQQELHDVNEQEYRLRAQLDILGYTRTHLTGMHMRWVGDPADQNGNHAYYWAKEAREYLQTPEEREVEQAKTEAAGRRKRLASVLVDPLAMEG